MKTVLRFLKPYKTKILLVILCMAAEAAEIQSYYKTHVENIVKNGTNYPEHEVRYEQTIVTPAVMMLAQYYMLTGDKKLVEECRRHVRVLERFNGDQPSHCLNEISMRHWDGYWFGKCMIYGDTLPHSASVHTSDAFLHYARISGDETYRKRAVRGRVWFCSVWYTATAPVSFSSKRSRIKSRGTPALKSLPSG